MEIEGCSVCQGPGQVGLFVCILLRIKSLDLHLPGKFVNGLPYKLGKLGKMFISKQDNGLQCSRSRGVRRVCAPPRAKMDTLDRIVKDLK